MEIMVGLWGTLLGLASVVLHIAVPIYLYNKAKEDGLPKPALWILFGLFEPITALMIYYLIRYLQGKLGSSVPSDV